jgi:hypothetical protein
MQHKFKTTLELDVTVIAHVSPAVPPQPCSDPDHPAYSDPGDPGERSVEAVLLRSTTGKTVDITDFLTDKELEALADEAASDAEEKFSDA